MIDLIKRRNFMRRITQFLFLIAILATSITVEAELSSDSALFLKHCEQIALAAQAADYSIRNLIDSRTSNQRSESIERADKSILAFEEEILLFVDAVEVFRQKKAVSGQSDKNFYNQLDRMLSGVTRLEKLNLYDTYNSSIGSNSVDEVKLQKLCNAISEEFDFGGLNGITETLPMRRKKIQAGSARSESSSSPKMIQNSFNEVLVRIENSRRRSKSTSEYIESRHPSVVGQADELGYNPLAIFNYVRYSVEYEPYPGLRKSPSSLVKGGKANDLDTAALTMSLLRASGVDCYVARADIEMTVEQFLGWLGIPYPDNRQTQLELAVKGSGYMNSLFPRVDDVFKSTVYMGSSTVKVRDHAFVVCHLDYVPSRGANRPAFIETPVSPPDPVSTAEPVDYASPDTWIPLDTSFKVYDLHWVDSSFPYQGVGVDFLMDLNREDENENADPVDSLMRKFLTDLKETPFDGSESPLFQTLPGRKIKYDSVEYLPSTLPYDIEENSLVVSTDDGPFDSSDNEVNLYVTFSATKLNNPGTTGLISGPDQYSIPLNQLNKESLMVRFVPEEGANPTYEGLIASGELERGIFDYEFAGSVIGSPRLFLNGEILSLPVGSELPIMDFVSEYFVYISVEDTFGNWINIENKAFAGDLYGVIPFIQSIDDGIDLQLTDEINRYIEESGNEEDGVPTIDMEDGLWTIEYWSKYLHLQGRHYFKQQYYSEESLAGMFTGKVIRDINLVRVGVTIDGMRVFGEGVLNSEKLSSFCDLDLYQVNMHPYGDSSGHEFFEAAMLNSSAGEHELFFRETNSHDSIVSAQKMLRNNEVIKLDCSNLSIIDEYIDSLGYDSMKLALKENLQNYCAESQWYEIEIPNMFTIIETPAEFGSRAKWVGTGYKLTKYENDEYSVGYMIFGRVLLSTEDEKSQVLSPREYGGAMGLPGTPKFFDEFGMEMEAICIQQVNLTRSKKFPEFTAQWENEYYHWLTLGTAKQWRWRFRTYAFKAMHWRLLCGDRYCVNGRKWVKVIYWDGQGLVCPEAPGKAPYLVAVFRHDNYPVEEIKGGIECLNLYNREWDPKYYQYPTLKRPPPSQCSGLPGIKWFDYCPWGFDAEPPCNLPSWKGEDLFQKSSGIWLGAFFGSATATEELYDSLNIGAQFSYVEPWPTPTITPYPEPTDTPHPVYTPSATPTPGFTSTPHPQYTVVANDFCDGFVANYDLPLSHPDAYSYADYWFLAADITRGSRNLRPSLEEYVNWCNPRAWSTTGLYGDLGAELFGAGYRGDPLFHQWNFDTEDSHRTPLPFNYHSGHVGDLEEKCIKYSILGHVTYCDSENIEPTPFPLNGLCPLDGAFVEVYCCNADTGLPTPSVCRGTPVCTAMPSYGNYDYRQRTELVRNHDPETAEEMPLVAEFDITTWDETGTFVLVPYHKDRKGRIDYAIEGSDPPVCLNPYPELITISSEETPGPVKLDEDIKLEYFGTSDCVETPLPDSAYLGDLSYIPDHYDKQGIAIEHPHFPLAGGGLVDTFTGKLNIVEPVISIPMNSGGNFTVNRFYSNTLQKNMAGTNPDLQLNDDCYLGLGWSLHLGKVVVSRGELPLIHGPDGTVRTAYNTNEEWDFHGPYKTRDGWELTFLSEGLPDDDTIFDSDITAKVVTADGFSFLLNQKSESYYGVCPFAECDQWSYVWHATSIIAPDGTTIADVEYIEPYIDEYDVRMTPVPNSMNRRLIRELPAIKEITYCFRGYDTVLEFEYEFEDFWSNYPDAPPVITSIKLDDEPLVEFQYDIESVFYHKMLNRVTHRSGEVLTRSSDLVYGYDYQPGIIDHNDLNQAGILRSCTLPTGLNQLYYYRERGVRVNEYDGSDNENPDLVGQRFLCVEYVSVPESGNSYSFNYDNSALTSETLIEVVSEIGGTSDRRVYEYIHAADPGTEEQRWGELEQVIVKNNSSRKVMQSVFTYEDVDMECPPLHPCAQNLYPLARRSIGSEVREYFPEQNGSDRVYHRSIGYASLENFPESLCPNLITVQGESSTGQLVDVAKTEITEYEEFQKDEHKMYLPKTVIHFIDSGKRSTTHLSYSDLMQLESINRDGMITSYTYTDGVLNGVGLPNGKQVNYTTGLDVTGNLEGFTFGYSLNNRGDLTETTDLNGQTTQINPDRLGRPIQIERPSLYPINISYPSSVQTCTSQGSVSVQTLVDEMGRFKRSRSTGDENFAYMRTVYGIFGRVDHRSIVIPSDYEPTGQGDHAGFYDYKYDSFGRINEIHDPMIGGQSDTDSDSPVIVTHGAFLKTVRDPENHLTEYHYDAAGDLIRIESPNGLVTDYEYDLAGNLLRVEQTGSDVSLQSRVFQYDVFGRVTYENQPETGSVWYRYGTSGFRNLERITYSDGTRVEFSGYDTLNRVGEVSYFASGEIEAQKREVYLYDDMPINIPDCDFPPEPAGGSCNTGHLRAVIVYDGSGNIVSANIWPWYNRAGYPVSKITFISAGDTFDQAVQMNAEFEYDFDGSSESNSEYGLLVGLTVSARIGDTLIEPKEVQYSYRDTGSLEDILLDDSLVVDQILHEEFGAVKRALLSNQIELFSSYNDGNCLEFKREGPLTYDYEFDGCRNIYSIDTSVLDTSGSTSVLMQTDTYEYDSVGRLETLTSNLQHGSSEVYEYQYDSHNNLIAKSYISDSEALHRSDFTYDTNRYIGVNLDCTSMYLCEADIWSETPIVGQGVEDLVGRTGFAFCEALGTGECMLFGGQRPDGTLLNDSWVYESDQWTSLDIEPPANLIGRRDHAMIFDSHRGVVILFGGYNASGDCLGDTWMYDGEVWQEMIPDSGWASDPINPVLCNTGDVSLLIAGNNAYTMQSSGGVYSWHHLVAFTEGFSCLAATYHENANRVIMVTDADTLWLDVSTAAFDSVCSPPSNHVASLIYDVSLEVVKCVTVSSGSERVFTLNNDEGIWDGEIEPVLTEDLYLLSFTGNRNQPSGFEFNDRGLRIADALNHYHYNAADEIVEIESKENVGESRRYTYDPSGKRVVEQVFFDDEEQSCLYRMYLGESPVFEFSSVESSRVYIYGENRLYAMANYSGATTEPELQFVLQDHLGSTTALLDSVKEIIWPSQVPGEGVKRQRYSPYGIFIDADDETGDEIPSFTGKFSDSDTGCHYFNARYYGSDDAKLNGPMQFTSPDPISGRISDPLSWNRYAYCQNNPIMYTDPTGKYLFLSTSSGAGFNQKMFQALQRVTTDELGVNPDGQIVIKSSGSIGPQTAGTQLLRTLIGNSFNNLIQEDTSRGSNCTVNYYEPGKLSNDPSPGDHALVSMNRSDPFGFATYGPNGCFKLGRLNKSDGVMITLAHELIHAAHINEGSSDDRAHTMTVYDSVGNSIVTNNKIEEFQTVGIGGYSVDSSYLSYGITENAIRTEQGFLPRISYDIGEYLIKSSYRHVPIKLKKISISTPWTP